jgi:hypothetical protein
MAGISEHTSLAHCVEHAPEVPHAHATMAALSVLVPSGFAAAQQDAQAAWVVSIPHPGSGPSFAAPESTVVVVPPESGFPNGFPASVAAAS